MAERGKSRWSANVESFSTDVGSILKSRLSINSSGIEWKQRHWDLDSISKIRWGGEGDRSTNMTYYVSFSNAEQHATISMRDREKFSKFVEVLWSAVGHRLLTEFLLDLRAGKTFHFGTYQTSIIQDSGVVFKKTKWRGEPEEDLIPWWYLRGGGHNGRFLIYSTLDDVDGHRPGDSWCYRRDDNIHVLEAAINLFERSKIDFRGLKKMSDLLG